MRTYENLYQNMISLPNLYKAYLESIKEKKKKRSVVRFEKDLHNNLWNLHQELCLNDYRVSPYTQFYVNDYKTRKILAPKIRDAVVHHAIYNYLEQIFDKTFISTSFACRKNKGSHKAFKKLRRYLYKYDGEDYFIKLDISKYFYSIDQYKLLEIIKKKIKDEELISIIEKIIFSHSEERISAHIDNPNYEEQRKGIPIGCLLSQLFANIYLNELDQYIKHKLKRKHYLRYVDDFVILVKKDEDINKLKEDIKNFVKEELFLTLKDEKIQINRISFGVDFVGFVCFKRYVRLRTKNYSRFKKNIKRKIYLFKNLMLSKKSLNSSFESYLGHVSHSDSNELKKRIYNLKVTVFNHGRAVQRGGNWNNGANAGPFYTNLNNAPDNTNTNIGFRCCSGLLQGIIPLRSYNYLRVQRWLQSTKVENRRGSPEYNIGASPMNNLLKIGVYLR